MTDVLVTRTFYKNSQLLEERFWKILKVKITPTLLRAFDCKSLELEMLSGLEQTVLRAVPQLDLSTTKERFLLSKDNVSPITNRFIKRMGEGKRFVFLKDKSFLMLVRKMKSLGLNKARYNDLLKTYITYRFRSISFWKRLKSLWFMRATLILPYHNSRELQ